VAEEHPGEAGRAPTHPFTGVARELREEAEREEAVAAYCGTVNSFDYAECAMHRSGRPSRTKIEELHRRWFDTGTALVVELGE
jgi:hypothetical protein